MIDPKQIPYEAVEAYLEAVEHGCGVREVLARAINAWPGVIAMHHPRENQHAIILPLSTDPSDD